MHVRRLLLASFLFSSTLVFAQVSFSPASLPEAYPGENYYQELHPAGGTAPYTWTVRGRLPQGITFDAPSATLSGIPTATGDFTFEIALTDATHHTVVRRNTIRVADGTQIVIAWTQPPAITNGGISGEVEVANPTKDTFDLTFICVAVNEVGRATALGYQRFSFGPGKQRIPFSSALPRGTYVVHADAVGEIARTLTIRRARLQSKPLVIP